MGFLFLALFILAFILCIVGEVMLIIAAFRTSVAWGLCVLFLGPAQLFFLIMHWGEAKRPFGIAMLGVLLGFAAVFSGKASSASPIGALAEALEKSGVAEQPLAALQKLAEENMESAGEGLKSAGQPSAARTLLGSDPKRLIGSTLTEVRTELGRPKGEMTSGGEKCLLYDDFTVFATDGETVSHVEIGGAEASGRAKSPRRRVTSAGATASPASAVRKIADGGQRIDLKKIIVPGKITVVDFYADWCGPCKRISPQLEQIARSDPDVVLCKVDIVDWSKPVVQQFGIRSIPNVRVYDRNGAAVGTPTAGLGAIKQNIERAR